MSVSGLDARTDAEQATELFLERVQQLPGVVRVQHTGDSAAEDDRNLCVYIGSRDREVEYGIYRLEAEVLNRYPTALLKVLVLLDADSAGAESDTRSVAL